MLPLVSRRIPRLTGTRSALKWVIACGRSSSYTRKSSRRRPGTKRPDESVTVAVTLISSMPDRNLNPWRSSGGALCGCCAASVAAAASARSGIRVHLRMTSPRSAILFAIQPSAFSNQHSLLVILRHRGRGLPPIDVRDDAPVLPAEPDAVARDGVGHRHGHDER